MPRKYKTLDELYEANRIKAIKYYYDNREKILSKSDHANELRRKRRLKKREEEGKILIINIPLSNS